MAKKEIAANNETGKTTVKTREPTNLFDSFRQEMDKLFDDFFGGFDLRPFPTKPDTFIPQIDVVDTDKEIRLSAELPGMDDKDIEVSLTNDTLIIRGEKKEDTERKGKGYYHSERTYGSFTRTVPLPIEVDTANVEASFKKGVLTIRLPKTNQAIGKAKTIAVKAE
jgi:HSP20 family protein